MRTTRALALLPLLLGAGCATVQELREEAIADFRQALSTGQAGVPLPPGARLDTVVVDSTTGSVVVRFNRQFGADPFRPSGVAALYGRISPYFAERFEGYRLSVQVRDTPIEELVPNFYRGSALPIDSSRLPRQGRLRPLPVVRNISRPAQPTEGLNGLNIALWHSHGWYYSVKEGRWEWQRPRLFQTVEDMIPMSFTLPYLVPMLENAGALVFLPRERETQKREIVVDNDRPGGSYLEHSARGVPGWKTGEGRGFAVGTPPYPVNHNPFLDGTFRQCAADSIPSATISWIPEFPEAGEYGIYISFASSPALHVCGGEEPGDRTGKSDEPQREAGAPGNGGRRPLRRRDGSRRTERPDQRKGEVP